MKIELGEDNGFLNNGSPTMVVVTVTMDDGKKVRFPYSACDKTISALFEDVYQFCKEAPGLKEVEPIIMKRPAGEVAGPRNTAKDIHFKIDENRIEREDIVRCIHLEKRESSCDLKVGGEYRVLKAHRKDLPTGPNGEMQTIYDGYDVVDDNSSNPIRTMVFPHEVTLFKKRSAPPPKVSTLEEMVICGFCQEPNALSLDKEKNKYTGDCVKCGKLIEAERPSAKSTDKTA